MKPGDAVRCKLKSLRGVACRIVGPAVLNTWDDDFQEIQTEEIPDTWMVRMVGDDQKFKVEESELEPLDEEEFCSSCGQIGCMHGRPYS